MMDGMPEGDTVWQAAARLDTALAGSELTRCDLRVPRLATVDLTGRVVESVQSRGKHLLTRFSHGWTLHSHLRMEGAWQVYQQGQAWRGGPGHQIRAILANEACAAVGYRLPVLELMRTADEHRAPGAVKARCCCLIAGTRCTRASTAIIGTGGALTTFPAIAASAPEGVAALAAKWVVQRQALEARCALLGENDVAGAARRRGECAGQAANISRAAYTGRNPLCSVSGRMSGVFGQTFGR